jgi:mono/diheme cytochrome c family protein
MNKKAAVCLLRAVVAATFLGMFAARVSALEPNLFARDIAPILAQHCVRCHSPGNAKGQISLATIDDLRENEYFIAGDPESSYLLELITADAGSKPDMPKEGKALAAEQVELIRRWIIEGATWPQETIVREKPKADRTWWSLQPLAVSAPPVVAGAPDSWGKNPIDRFVLAKLNEKGLKPNPPADRISLIRRATYDLTGLPPTPVEIEAFVNDSDPAAYAKLVERLLRSSHYGQRWGRHWLDVVRFGESTGYERNIIIDDLWPFRDYVIQSLNQDKPFNRMVREHLSGDVLGPGRFDVEIGSAFMVCGPYDNVGNQDLAQKAQIRANTIDEIIRATSEGFLGLTVGCARCHDHKFDPISQQDYYSLYATFSGVRHGSRIIATAQEQAARAAEINPLTQAKDELTSQREAIVKGAMERTLARLPEHEKHQDLPLQAVATTAEEKAKILQLDRAIAERTAAIRAIAPLANAWVGTDVAADAKGPFHVFIGGNPQRKGEPVVPSSLSGLREVAPVYQLPVDSSAADRRTALADWMVDRSNPLTPRVLANRLWHYHFGTGIVDTPSDFGYMGGRPSHPELLDWLARQVQLKDWRLKAMHRQIMLSETYRQSSDFRPQAANVDRASRLLWRFPPRRLSAEEIRDTALSVAGKLDLKMGGPGFRLYRYLQDNVATYVPLDQHGPETYRRAVYHQNARASIIDFMTDYDQPDCAFATPRRSATTTPLQSLTALNHSFTLDMARAMAERLEAGSGAEEAAQVQLAFNLCYGRDPVAGERDECVKFIRHHSLRAFCRVMLNTSELIYLR